MYHRIASAIIALSFLVLLQYFSSVFRFLIGAVAVYLIISAIYNYWYLRTNNIYNRWALLRPALFSLALISIYFIVPNTLIKGFFLIFATLLIFLVELAMAVASEQLNYFQTLITYFGMSMAVFALNFYYLPKNTIILAVIFLATLMISRTSLDYIPQNNEKKNFFSALLSLAMMQIAWALMLLPLHFSVLAVILFNAFYVLWIIVYYHLFNNLSTKKITFHITFSSIIVVVLMLITPWS